MTKLRIYIVAGLSLLRQTPVALMAPVTPARGPWVGVSGGDTPTIKSERWRRVKRATAARIDRDAEISKRRKIYQGEKKSRFHTSTYLFIEVLSSRETVSRYGNLTDVGHGL